MLLSELVKGINCQIYNGDCQILGVTMDSKKVKCGWLFVALSGTKFNGNDYINDVKNVAAAVVTDKYIEDCKLVQVITSDTRLAYSLISANFYGNPQNRLKIIGVVGTNGKTSVTKIIYQLLSLNGNEGAAVGTFGVMSKMGEYYTGHTTPDPEILYKCFSEFVGNGINFVVMEVSAHAIAQKKVSPINFECLIFTNCTQDHLDYFGTFQNYSNTKYSIFSSNSKYFIVNIDDNLGKRIYQENKEKTFTYSATQKADLVAQNIREFKDKTTYNLITKTGNYQVKTQMLGRFNVYNQLASLLACHLLGIKMSALVNYIDSLIAILGRMQQINYQRGNIYIDYAHTPDGLKVSLEFLKSVTIGKVIIVFGAGGNRDQTKRELMGMVANSLADIIILTNDNPRQESPEKIIEQIKTKITKPTIIEMDRFLAIKKGIELLNVGDSLLIAGKGDENYQEIKGKKYKFNDLDAVKDIINKI